ncbi:hypothetical protein QBD01_003682 [Ochrobactrum sp. 19YEA23]|uniref:hypothetical protein n=1 Tax=Ochrobactrum sp. 19YEA23 TaxID=3039854 RepID=UPI00247AEB92|nr:hypothetical protein [Ochrobactrum sp. 19YEA23]
MAKFNYARSVATANRLIDKFGQTGAIRRTETSGDPWNPGTSDTDYPCTLAVLEISLQDVGKDIGGTLIKASDKRILVAVGGLPITPTTTDKVITADGIFTITKASTLSPAGIAVFHDLVASR